MFICLTTSNKQKVTQTFKANRDKTCLLCSLTNPEFVWDLSSVSLSFIHHSRLLAMNVHLISAHIGQILLSIVFSP